MPGFSKGLNRRIYAQLAEGDKLDPITITPPISFYELNASSPTPVHNTWTLCDGRVFLFE
jgi:hypothetical protein